MKIPRVSAASESRAAPGVRHEAALAREPLFGRVSLAGFHCTIAFDDPALPRWTVVDSYKADGLRYIVAREDHTRGAGPNALSGRERQVVAGLASGQTTKEIGYGLGIDASTVRVLLRRAAAKLGVVGRAGVLDHPAVRALRCGLDPSARAGLRCQAEQKIDAAGSAAEIHPPKCGVPPGEPFTRGTLPCPAIARVSAPRATAPRPRSPFVSRRDTCSSLPAR